jgi:CPA1 family monovalent cation:H+ antiporter
MPEFELVLLLLVAVALIVTLARRLNVPYPILLILGGLVLAALPQVPDVELDPEVVLVIFLPPLIFAAAWQTPVHDLRRNLRPVLLLSVGLVVFTALVVGAVMQWLVPGLPLAAAIGFGAIVAPTDAVAATSVLRRMAVPRRVLLILESESLLNDATALTLYRAAIAAVAAGGFILSDTLVTFGVAAIGGLLFGLGLAVVIARLWARLFDPPVEVTLSLLIPYAAYLPAETFHFSGVIATATCGLYLGFRSSRLLASDARVLANGTWEILVFILNGFAFMLIGLQLKVTAAGLIGHTPAELAILSVVIALVVIATRFVLIIPAVVVPRWLMTMVDPGRSQRAMASALVIAWAGLRGVVSLALALALPLDFPERNLLIFLTFVVIMVTLVGQGLTLPLLLRKLGISDGDAASREDTAARQIALDAGLSRLDGLRDEWPDHLPLIHNIEERLQHRSEHLPSAGTDDDERDQELREHRAILGAVLGAEREAIVSARDHDEIGDEALRRLERELDLEELRLESEL